LALCELSRDARDCLVVVICVASRSNVQSLVDLVETLGHWRVALFRCRILNA